MIGEFVAAVVIAYLLGSIPFGLIIGKLKEGIDIREQGSGKTGATNLMRVAGTRLGIWAIVPDGGNDVFWHGIRIFPSRRHIRCRGSGHSSATQSAHVSGFSSGSPGHLVPDAASDRSLQLASSHLFDLRFRSHCADRLSTPGQHQTLKTGHGTPIMVKDRQSSRPRVTIIGNTSWGNTLGAVLGEKGVEVRLWTRSEAEAQGLTQGGGNYSSTSCLQEALSEANLVIWVVPSQKLRDNVAQARGYLTNSMLLMSAAKGLEAHSGKRMSQVLAEEIASSMTGHLCVLSGPNLAGEIAQGLPAATVIASHDVALAEKARKLMESPKFVISTSDDVIGVELGGALKNIIALGAGMMDGLGLGGNAKGAFLAWGWTEVVSLGVG